LAQVVKSGLNDSQVGQFFWCTITAPGVESLPWDEDVCNHAPEVACSGKIGCRVGDFDAAVWNGTAPRRWSWFMTYLRRKLSPGDPSAVQFCGVWEDQDRGVLHRHFLIRVERPTTERRVKAQVRASGKRWGFGSSYDVRGLTGEGAREVWYVAKYAAKTVDAVEDRPMLDVRTGELKASRGFRAWSCSRRWGDSMASVKAAQLGWVRSGGGAGRHTPDAPAGAAGVGLDSNTDISTVVPCVGSSLCAVAVSHLPL
jgi:hypothetical protein